MSPVEAPESKQASPGRAERFSRRIRDFWQRVTEGFEVEALWAQLRTEARASYGLYSQEVNWEAIARESRWQRPFYIARALFWAMLMKLSPARRVLLLAAIAFLFLGRLEFRAREVSATIELSSLGALLLFLLLALELADRVTMKRDLEIAREIQRWLVPEVPPRVPGVDIAFATRPANTVAGDYYDAFFRPAGDGAAARAAGHDAPAANRLLLVVADVAGKSVPAALLMATFQASLQALAAAPTSLAEVIAGLNRYAHAHSLGGLRFTTAFLAELDPSTRALRYINAGHNSPVLRRASGRVERLATGGLPLGIEAETRYDAGEVSLASGDLLVIFTDGVVEAVNAEGEEFGEARLLGRLDTLPGESAAETLKHLMATVDGFVGLARQHDDVTCLVVRTA